MNFLWDITLRAKAGGKRENDLFFRQAKEYSPFYEQAFLCINETEIKSNEMEVNLFYRFADIFQEILSEDVTDFPEFQLYLIDAILHAIVWTDLRHGVSKREIYIRKLIEEIREGVFWSDLAKEFPIIPVNKQNRLATLVLTQMETGSSLLTYRRAILILFPDAMLYQVRADRKNLLLYLNDKETDNRKRMLQFAQDMFLPLSYHIRVFWEYHFGVIGVEDTMKMDEIAIY